MRRKKCDQSYRQTNNNKKQSIISREIFLFIKKISTFYLAQDRGTISSKLHLWTSPSIAGFCTQKPRSAAPYWLLSAVTAKNYFKTQLVGNKKNHGAVIIPKAILIVLALFLSFIFLYKIK